MKPILISNYPRTASRSFRHFPSIDSQFQTAVLPKFGRGRACPQLPSFRSISTDYFRKEARGEFRLELAAFTAIGMTAAVPIFSNAHALADFLRAISHL